MSVLLKLWVCGDESHVLYHSDGHDQRHKKHKASVKVTYRSVFSTLFFSTTQKVYTDMIVYITKYNDLLILN